MYCTYDLAPPSAAPTLTRNPITYDYPGTSFRAREFEFKLVHHRHEIVS